MKHMLTILLCLIAWPAGSNAGQAQSETKTSQEVRTLLTQGAQLARSGQYAEAAASLEKYVQIQPQNISAHCLLALVEFRAQRKTEALAEFKVIENAPPTSDSESCLKKLTPSLRPELNQDMEKKLDTSLFELKSEEALSTVDEMYLEAHQKELLKFYINRRQGSLANAFSRLMTIRTLNSEAPIESLRKDVVADAALFQEIKARVDWYRYSALTNGSGTPDWVRKEIPKQNYSLLEYARLIANAEQHFPLNGWVLDQAFFATLLAKPYEDVESLGDKILGAKGTLRIPFYSRGSLFDLVIDVRKSRLRTEPDSRVPANESGSDRMLDLEPFDLAFEQITSLSQKAPSDIETLALGKQSYAVKLAPSGLAPYYAFMDVIHSLYGEAAQKTITANLGQFILHVAKNAKLSSHLVNPQSKTHDWLRITTTTIALGTIASSQIGNINSNNEMKAQSASITGNAMNVLAENKIEAAKTKSISLAQSEEEQTWHDQTLHVIFSEIVAERARELEKFENKLLSKMEVPAAK
jgi:hypothetical protein